MNKRVYSIDICRAAALMIMMIYHCWVLTGSLAFPSNAVTLIISIGGEIGVTAFFLLSGYGIYCSIHSQEDHFNYFDFLKKRAKRIAPQYYLSIIVALLLGDGAAYLSSYGMKSILTHFLFIHNLFPECSGAINGALWTMGVIVQFYFIVYFLYKGLRKWEGVFALASILFTISAKAIMYAVILPKFGVQDTLAFWSGRQLITSLDNFVIGMYAAHLTTSKKIKLPPLIAYAGVAFGSALVYFICYFGIKTGIHTNNFSGYTWHSFLSIAIGIILFFASHISVNKNNKIAGAIIWIAKYEYGIYIWHLLIINNLLDKSDWVKRILASSHPKLVYLIFIACSIGVGYIFTELTESFMNSRFSAKDTKRQSVH